MNANGWGYPSPNGPVACVGANGQWLWANSLCGNLSSMNYDFEIGQQLTFAAPGTGQLGCMNNDVVGDYGDNSGEQIVRVVVTVR